MYSDLLFYLERNFAIEILGYGLLADHKVMPGNHKGDA